MTYGREQDASEFYTGFIDYAADAVTPDRYE